MSALLRGKDVSGLPVVDLSTGEDIAEIRDLIFDPAAGVVGGFTLAKRGFLGRRMREVLPVDAVHSLGTHAVTVDSAAALTGPADAPQDVATVDRKADVTSNDVLTESGRNLGRVHDVILTGGRRPRVVGYEIGGGAAGDGFVPIDTSRAVSRSALIVPDGFENRVRTDLTGLAGEIDALGGPRDPAQ
jgi:uncharacterized protein YrrD